MKGLFNLSPQKGKQIYASNLVVLNETEELSEEE